MSNNATSTIRQLVANDNPIFLWKENVFKLFLPCNVMTKLLTVVENVDVWAKSANIGQRCVEASVFQWSPDLCSSKVIVVGGMSIIDRWLRAYPWWNEIFHACMISVDTCSYDWKGVLKYLYWVAASAF